MLLQGLLQVLQHFEHYSNIPQIKDMSSQLKQIQVQVLTFMHCRAVSVRLGGTRTFLRGHFCVVPDL